MDPLCDRDADLLNQNYFNKLKGWIVQGRVLAVLGSPPCSTISAARFCRLPGGHGPRPSDIAIEFLNVFPIGHLLKFTHVLWVPHCFSGRFSCYCGLLVLGLGHALNTPVIVVILSRASSTLPPCTISCVSLPVCSLFSINVLLEPALSNQPNSPHPIEVCVHTSCLWVATAVAIIRVGTRSP